jgi:hypothetical protein
VTEWLPEWLFEGRPLVYAALLGALVFLAFVWKQTPRSGYLVTGGVLAAVIGLYFLLDVLVETDREQIEHSVADMTAAVEARNVDRIFSHVSESYNRHGMNKAGFRSAVTGVVDGRHVDRIAVWGWEFAPDYKTKESASDPRDNVGRVRFMAKPVGPDGQNLYQVDAVMHRDADGKWRLQSWEVFDPFHNSTAPMAVPYVP